MSGRDYVRGYLIFKRVRHEFEENFILLDYNVSLQNTIGSECIGQSIRFFLEKLNLSDEKWEEAISGLLNQRIRKYKGKLSLHNLTYDITLEITDINYLSVIIAAPNDDIEFVKKVIPSEVDLIFNSSQDALFLLEVEQGNYRYVKSNAYHEEMSGYSAKYLYGKTPMEILGEQQGKKQIAYLDKCIETKQTITVEEIQEFRGRRRNLLTKYTPIYQGNEKSHIVCSRVDITSIKKRYDVQNEALQKFKLLFDMHEATMLLIDPETGAIIDANPAACEFYGYSEREIKALNISDINTLSKEEVREKRMHASAKDQSKFLFPHKLKTGEVKLVDVFSCPVNFEGKNLLYSIIMDVSERESNKIDLFKEKELLNITFESIGDGVVTTDELGIITRINKAAEEIIKWGKEEVVGQKFSDIFQMRSEVTGHRNDDIIEYVLKTQKIQELANHTEVIDKFGNAVPIADSAAPIIGRDKNVLGAVMVFRDVSQEKAKKERILYLSYHDVLTGLYNRRFYDEQMSHINGRTNGNLAILMGDVNGLKMVNDVFGHKFGDLVLKTIGQVLKSYLGNRAIAMRWGGDEFVVIVEQPNISTIETILKQVNEKLRENKINDIVEISISFGYAIKDGLEEPMDSVLQKAEEMMYRMKLLDSKSMRSTFLNTILATLDANSSETKAHAERIKGNCLKMGELLNLKANELSDLSVLAMLHDIGKVGVPQHILNKPGPLTELEWVEMKRHSEIGYRIAHNVPDLTGIAEHILFHHEKWDGSGYPNGLKGQEIPIECRILAVADAFDAMINNRVYRKAMSREIAIQELIDQSGSHFDPRIVNCFLEILGNE